MEYKYVGKREKTINMKSKKLVPGTSISEPDLTTADKYKWKSGFPPGVTVDELCFYRKKRPPVESRPRDNLGAEDGSFKAMKSEYTKKYVNYFVLSSSCGNLPTEHKDMSPIRVDKPEDTLKLEGEQEHRPEYHEVYKNYPTQKGSRRVRNLYAEDNIISDNIKLDEMDGFDKSLFSTEIQSKYIKYPYIRRRSLLRRQNNLKLEGDLFTTTEKAEQFIEYLLSSRPDLTRKPTTLKLEGEMDVKTENRDKYVPLEYQRRPPLCKKYTNLHLEGELGILTENHEKYVPFDMCKRPPLTKRRSNLHLEGDLELMPEYRDAYKEYKMERVKPTIPVNNLKTDGFFNTKEETTSFLDHQMHPKIPFLRGSLGEYSTTRNVETKKTEESLKNKDVAELEMENKTEIIGEKLTLSKPEEKRTSANLNLEGRIDMNPEYRNAYIDFFRQGRTSPNRRRRRQSHYSSLKNEGLMDTRPEYQSSYIDFPRERPSLRRPENSLSSEGEIQHSTEKRSQYVPHSHISKAESMKREPELKLEGNFECQPEYRKAYIDYLIRERVERKSRPLDNLGSQPQRAFAILPVKQTQNTNIKEKSQENVDSNNLLAPIQPTKLVVSPPTITSESSTEESNKPQSPSPSPPPKSATKQVPTKSLKRLESSLFGPKLTVPSQTPSRTASRSTSPLSQVTRRRSTSQCKSTSRQRSPLPGERRQRNMSSRFGSPVRVENLACRNTCTSTLPSSMFSASRKSNWRRENSVDDRTKAFVVLDDEINNNGTKYDINNSSSDLDNKYCKEQKWMPSWYNNNPRS